MNKATFVSELPTNATGNEVPTLNLVKSLISSPTQSSSTQPQTTDINGQPVFYAILSEKLNGAIFEGILYILNTPIYISTKLFNGAIFEGILYILNTPIYISTKLFDQQLVGFMSKNTLSQSFNSINFVFITLDTKEYLALKFECTGDLITPCKMFPIQGGGKWIKEEVSEESSVNGPIVVNLN